MHNINADITLSEEAKYLIEMLEDELTAEEIAYEMNISLHNVKILLKHLMEMKLVKCHEDIYQLDALGTKKLLELSSVLK